jgi:hypothetical protein
MAKNSYHVIVKSDGKWNVIKTGAERASGSFSTKKEAVTTARELVTKSGGGELIIHKKDGRVSKRDSYGNEPIPPKVNGRNSAGTSSRSIKE